MFFLWASFVVLATQGFNITTNLGNTIQYIGRIILTSDGSSQGSTGIILDGANGNAFFSGNVGISWSISATTWFINNFSATTWSIGNLDVTKDFSLHGSWTINGNLDVTKNLSVTENVSIGTWISSQKLEINGNIKLSTGWWIGATGTNQLSLGTNGNVGISTPASSEKLSINGNIKINDSQTQTPSLIMENNETIFSITNNLPDSNFVIRGTGIGNYSMVFWLYWLEAMRIDKMGRIGIGTQSPSQRLEVNGNIKFSQPGWIGTTPDQIAFWSNGNIGIWWFADSNKLRVHGSLYSDSFKNAQLTIWSNNITMTPVDWGTPWYKMKIIWSNNNYGSAYESCIIGNPNCKDWWDIVIVPGNSYADSDNWNIFLGFDNGSAVWKVGIGTWISSDTRLNIGWSIRVYGSWTFTNAVTAQAFFYSSDRRYKDNITLITDPLQKLLGLNGYTFNWKDTGRADIWVIAQEVEQVFPQAVATNAEGYKSVEYGNLVAPLIEAVKALYYKYLDQEARIEKMEQEISLLKNTID